MLRGAKAHIALAASLSRPDVVGPAAWRGLDDTGGGRVEERAASAQPRLPLGREAASAGPAARSSVSSECNVAHDLEAPPTARADEATGSPPQPLTARSLSEWRGFE